jgi:hypothetical protein
VISEKGFYYRVAFTHLKTPVSIGKVTAALTNSENVPNSEDVYCEIKVVMPTIKLNAE